MKFKGICVTATLILAAGWSGAARAQQAAGGSQDQPQQQQKAAEKSNDKAAKKPQAATPAPAPADDNAFPEAESEAAAKAAKQQSAGQDNKGQANSPDQNSGGQSAAPPAYSSSRAGGDDPDLDDPVEKPGDKRTRLKLHDEGSNGENPARSRKDDDVAKFYFQSGNYLAAYSRYKDAFANDAEDDDAEFGAAESARKLHKDAEAAQLYASYIRHFPDALKVKEANKALRELNAAAAKH